MTFKIKIFTLNLKSKSQEYEIKCQTFHSKKAKFVLLKVTNVRSKTQILVLRVKILRLKLKKF